MKRVYKTLNAIQVVYDELVGLFYDIRELAFDYRGNLITLCVPVAVAILNHNRGDAGMFFIFFEKRSTVTIETKYQYVRSTLEDTTVQINPTNSADEGIF